MTEQSEHLSSAQIENYGNRTSGAGPEAAQRDEHLRANHQSSDDQRVHDQRVIDQQIDQRVTDQRVLDQSVSDERVEAHLADCASCRNRLLDFHRHRFALLSGPAPDAKPTDSALADSNSANPKYPADPQVRTAATPECPSDDTLRQLAAGLTPGALAAQLTQHASTCDHCGPLLRTYTEIFSDDFTPEEQAALANLQSSSAEWQKNTARQMLEAAGTARKTSIPKSRLFNLSSMWPQAAALAAVAACLVFAWIKIRTPNELQTAQRLVAAAFEERRTTEMRLTSVPYGPYRPLPVERSGADESESRLERSNLISAEAALAQQQKKTTLDASWLQIKGRLALLSGTTNSAAKAVGDFQKVRSSGTDNASVQIDLAAAYFELDTKSDHPDLQRSLDLFTRVLKMPTLSPQDRSVTLFDLAIVYEKTQAWDLAVSTWEQYLQIDPDGPWAQEAKQRLASARTKIRSQEQRRPDRAISPSSLLRVPPPDVLLESLELYQEKALRSWLVLALTDSQSDSARALSQLARLLAEKHSDFWLTDFLKKVSRQDVEAAEHLQLAIESNERGLYEEARQHSVSAEKTFEEHRNSPGVLRAQYERIYASARSLTSAPCLDLANSVLPKLDALSYPWLNSQLLLERAICENHQGNLSASDADLKTSLAMAHDSQFLVLELRTLGITASLKRQQGKREEAWRYSIEGLRQYWQGPPFPDRLYQFYAGMELTSQEQGLTYAAEALGRQAISILAAENDNVQLGAAHLLLADLLVGEKEDALAQAEVEKADSLLATAPNEPTANRYKLISKIRLARFELERGEPQAALKTLEPARELLGSTRAYFVTLAFHIAEGDSHFVLGHLSEAAVSYRSAIHIAEQSLNTLHDEGSRLKWVKESDGAYRGLIRLLLKQDKPEEALRRWEWYRDLAASPGPTSAHLKNEGAAFATLKYPSHSFSQARVVYAVFRDGIQIWTINAVGASSTWVSFRESELLTMARDFSERCSTPESSLIVLREESRKLFTLLVKPVVSKLDKAKTVVLETDGDISNVPLEALLSPQGWYFGEKYSLVNSPGMLQEARLRRPMPMGPNLSVLLVDSAEHAGTSYLPGHLSENESIRHLFPSARAVDPTRSSWQEIQRSISVSQTLHFIGHGVRTAAGAGLLLQAGVPPLTAADFSPDRLSRTRLVVLSACSTGATDDNGLLDTTSLVHAFLAARVPSVVSSRWNIDSEATAALMIVLYTHIHSGEPPALAMHAAIQQALLEKRHPYFWAGFTVTGRSL
ncbi:MAG: CHAT domain-containing protein [Terriglobales bacterium]